MDWWMPLPGDPGANQTNWLHYPEQSPNSEDNVFFWDRGFGRVLIGRFAEGIFSGWRGSTKSITGKLVHWLPLPKPPNSQ